VGRHDLTNHQWRALEPLLPARAKRGRGYRDHRTVLNGILWKLRTGAPWRDVPERYGPYRTLHDRLARWAADGTWRRVLRQLQALADAHGGPDWEGCALDSTHVKAHRAASGARRAARRGRPRT
jgi:transposase